MDASHFVQETLYDGTIWYCDANTCDIGRLLVE
jgi:hypothetical protein